MKKKESSGLGGKILLILVGAALIAISLINIILFIVGDLAIANVSTRRMGGAIDGRPLSSRYEWSIDYSFVAVDSKTYHGTLRRHGSDISVEVERKVYYLPINPRINALSSEVTPNIGQLIMILLGGFLI